MVQVFFGAQNVKSLGCVFFLAQGSRGLVLHGICPAGDGPKKVTRPCECAMWGPRSIAKLVQITPITTVYGKYNYSIHGANLNQQTSLGRPTLWVCCNAPWAFRLGVFQWGPVFQKKLTWNGVFKPSFIPKFQSSKAHIPCVIIYKPKVVYLSAFDSQRVNCNLRFSNVMLLLSISLVFHLDPFQAFPGFSAKIVTNMYLIGGFNPSEKY